MENIPRTILTTGLIYVKIICLGLLCLSVKLLFNDSKVIDGVDFETDFEHKAYLFFALGSLIYSFTRPKISFDDVNLYTKKINKKQEIIIPLKNITSIFKNPFGSRGSNMITIEFINNSNESSSIKFTADYFSSRLKKLTGYTQQKNTHVEIV